MAHVNHVDPINRLLRQALSSTGPRDDDMVPRFRGVASCDKCTLSQQQRKSKVASGADLRALDEAARVLRACGKAELAKRVSDARGTLIV
jgi:hypothetical protein